MVPVDFNRRMLLHLGLGVSAGLFYCSPSMAQQRKLFGIKLPKEIADLLPQKILTVAETADALIALEREADAYLLPKSLLQFDEGVSVSPADTSFYALVLPRLVALIDRSEFSNSGFADKAGGLLAQLHATQYALPDGLRGFAGVPGFDGQVQGRLSLDPQQDRSLPPILDLPVQPTTVPPSTVPPNDPAATDTPPMDTLPAPQSELPKPSAPEPSISEPPTASIPQTETKPSVSQKEEADQPISRRRDFASLASEYSRMFATISVRPERSRMADWHLTMLRNSRQRYQVVGDSTGVPWYFIGIIHGLEASFNFRAHLHNGDFPLSSRTRQVPSGRPRIWLPPADWGSSARDALALLGFTGQRDWSLERTLYRLEAYNGLGYRNYGVPSPYLWSFSNHYQSGKYVADGRWSASARSQQCGAAVMLKLLSDAGDIKLA